MRGFVFAIQSFCDFWCVAAGGGADCGVLRSRYRVFCDFVCVAAGGGADCGAVRAADAGWRWLGRCCLVAGMAVVLVVSLVVSLVVWRAVRLRVP